MAQPYVGEIRMFGGNFAPVGWQFCDGSLLPISENETLFNLIGTLYGGDGQSTFGVPDLRGRIPIHVGGGFAQGQTGGVETVTLSTQQMPTHTHPFVASTDPANTLNAQGNVLGTPLTATPFFQAPPATPLSPQSILPVGNNLPHENIQPYLCVSFIISLFGIFPSQT
jgi:microcystin-dependent protein